MSNLIRWDPFRDMMTLRANMDRLFDSAMFGSGEDWLQTTSWDVSMDLAETDNEYIVKASLPGINPDDLEVTYDNNILTIKGELKQEKDVEESRYHLRERRYGNFSRSISLPGTINAEEIAASYDSGVLTLSLPKLEEAKPHRIQVQRGGTSKMIEGQVK
jgi:HSP20 family protein